MALPRNTPNPKTIQFSKSTITILKHELPSRRVYTHFYLALGLSIHIITGYPFVFGIGMVYAALYVMTQPVWNLVPSVSTFRVSNTENMYV